MANEKSKGAKAWLHQSCRILKSCPEMTAMEFATTVAAILSIPCATVEWQSASTHIAILVAEPRFSLSGIIECPSCPIVPGNRRFVRRWSHTSNRASAMVALKKGRLPDVPIATILYRPKPQPSTSKQMLLAPKRDGDGKETGMTCTAS
jgi:hypothetical protein